MTSNQKSSLRGRDIPMNQANEQALVTRIALRLVPFLFLLYVVAYLDRVNVGFAQLQMKHDLGFSDRVYSVGAGIFFLGYFLFEVPSNLILERVGARRWIARIMFTWGLIAMAMMFIRGTTSFIALRFLLGLAEAGFFPGVILYMTYWFTAAERARIVAWFMTANAVAYIFGGPVSGLLLNLRGVGGLLGWQWLFLLEGIPAVLLGGVVLIYLPDSPEKAPWLSPDEKSWMRRRMQAEQDHKSQHGKLSMRDALVHPTVWLFCALYFTMVVGMYGIGLWLPQLIKNFQGLSDLQVGLLTAIPYLTAAVAMVLVAWNSDRTRERRFHLAISAFIGALGLALGARLHSPVLQLAALSVAAGGMWSTLGPFWSMPTAFLGGTAAAGGLALINSVGNLGGFVGPFLVGYVKDITHSFSGGLLVLAASMIVAGFLAISTRGLAMPPVESDLLSTPPPKRDSEEPLLDSTLNL